MSFHFCEIAVGNLKILVFCFASITDIENGKITILTSFVVLLELSFPSKFGSFVVKQIRDIAICPL